MTRRLGWTCWLVAACSTACGRCDRPGAHGQADDDAIEADVDCRTPIRPFRDEWRVEASLAFPHEDGEITSLQVGGLLSDGNFANRGDVIVRYDGEPGRIVVELRRFTAAIDEESAREDFDALHLWAFASAVDRPMPPFAMPPEDSCTRDFWRDGCGIRVYYDGLSQLARAGADIRVTLPADYMGELEVVTEDNDDGTGYANRGNVCIDGAPAGANVSLQSGEAFVIVADDTVPTPTCPPEDVALCESWPAGAWALDCPCLTAGHAFGTVRVRTTDAGAADVTVDLPPDLWSAISLANKGPGQDASDPELHCEAHVLFQDVDRTITPDEFPWTDWGSINVPSEAATAGGGFFVDVASALCGPFPATEEPEAYDCEHEWQESDKRGDLWACAGCLRERSCDELVP